MQTNLNKKKKSEELLWKNPWIWVVGVVLIAGSTLVIISGQKALKEGPRVSLLPNQPVAIVDGKEIQRFQLDNRLNQIAPNLEAQGIDLRDKEARSILENQVLLSIIGETLLIKKALQSGADVPAEDIEAQYQGILTQVGSEAELKQQLSTNNASIDDLREEIKEQLALRIYIKELVSEEDVAVSDAELDDAYNELSAQDPSVPHFPEISAQLKAQLGQLKMEQILSPIIDALREAADIEILL